MELSIHFKQCQVPIDIQVDVIFPENGLIRHVVAELEMKMNMNVFISLDLDNARIIVEVRALHVEEVVAAGVTPDYDGFDDGVEGEGEPVRHAVADQDFGRVAGRTPEVREVSGIGDCSADARLSFLHRRGSIRVICVHGGEDR